MKWFLTVVCAGILTAGFWCGCGSKKEEPPSPTPAPVKTSPALPATTSTPSPTPTAPSAPTVQQTVADIQADINKALALAKEGKYTEALAELQQLATKTNLTSDQKKSIEDAIAQIKQWAAEAVTKSVTEKAPVTLPKSLPLK